LRDSPSLQREVSGLVEDEIPVAAELAAGDLNKFGEPMDGITARLDRGGFTAEQVIGDWFPGTGNDVASA
jgi:hypothetical protein